MGEEGVPGIDEYARKLYLADFLRGPVMRQAINALELPTGSHGLDAGCGIGSIALLLAEEVGPAGRVTGVDTEPGLLAYADEAAEKRGLIGRVSFRQGDVNELPFSDDTFDWAWSSDCVGHPVVGEPLPSLKELARVVKPGGTVAILGWAFQQFLPGYQLLEARMNAPSAAFAATVTGKRPDSQFLRALGWFPGAGLEGAAARTFAGDISAPLSDDVKSALLMFFDMLWEKARPEVSPEDWEVYERITRPGSPEFILDLPEYYAFFTITMFYGKVS
jgi:demethylmenaquinone methyltransferase/2-methoxy-6-polyprenyl-1,4-benzoquinol methylase